MFDVVAMCQHFQEVQAAALRLGNGSLKRSLCVSLMTGLRVATAKPGVRLAHHGLCCRAQMPDRAAPGKTGSRSLA